MSVTFIWHALFGIQPIDNNGWTLHPQVIWMALLVFSAVAAWFDVRLRRIPNLWNLCGVCGFLALQIGFGDGIGAILSVIITGLLLLIPTLHEVWGQGDWKMAMVYGAALGVLPTLVVWWLAVLLAKIYRTVAKKCKIRWLHIDGKTGLPVAVFVLMASILFFATLFLT